MSKEHALPQDGPTMKQIYQQHFQSLRGDGADGARQRIRRGNSVGERVLPATAASGHKLETSAAHLASYTRDAQREIEAIFPTLPNPTLVMYVFPHLSTREGLPVPGYSTTFRMYQTDHYALPGEVPVFDDGR